jgi:integrase
MHIAAFASLGPIARDYLDALSRANQPIRKNIERLLRLKDQYGAAPSLIAVIEKALHYKAYGAEYVENILYQQMTPQNNHPLKGINPAHCFRHSCAVNMLASGCSLSYIKNHLGHENVQSTMAYLHMDLSCKREVQRKFIEYTQSILKHNSKIEELID